MSGIAAGEKRIKNINESAQKANIVLLDIEGTVTSISFVKDTLFPYIRENLENYLKNHWDSAEFQEDLVSLRAQATTDAANNVEGLVTIPDGSGDAVREAVMKNVLWQMDLDRKTAALKTLQGHIMQQGYSSGVLKGHVYADVAPVLKSWVHSGKELFVYSSGSVAAQKLLFEHSKEGNLLELFSGHFDTEIGAKNEASSYSNIVKKLDCKGEDIVFFTDVSSEAKAAQEAGLNTILVSRPGNAPLSEEDRVNFSVIKTLNDFVFEVPAKRKKMSVEEETSPKINALVNGPSAEPNSKTDDVTSNNKSTEDVEMIDVGGAGDAKEVSKSGDKGSIIPLNGEITEGKKEVDNCVSTNHVELDEKEADGKKEECPPTEAKECNIKDSTESVDVNQKAGEGEEKTKAPESSQLQEKESIEANTKKPEEKKLEELKTGRKEITDDCPMEVDAVIEVLSPKNEAQVEKLIPSEEMKTKGSLQADDKNTEELLPVNGNEAVELVLVAGKEDTKSVPPENIHSMSSGEESCTKLSTSKEAESLSLVKKTTNESLPQGKKEAVLLPLDKKDADELSLEKKKTEELSLEKKNTEELSLEKKNTEELSLENKKTEELSLEKKETEELSLGKKETKVLSQEKKETEELSLEKKKTEELSLEKKKTEELSLEKKKTEELSLEKKKTEELSLEKKQTEELSQEKKKTEELSQEKKKTEELSQEKKRSEPLPMGWKEAGESTLDVKEAGELTLDVKGAGELTLSKKEADESSLSMKETSKSTPTSDGMTEVSKTTEVKDTEGLILSAKEKLPELKSTGENESDEPMETEESKTKDSLSTESECKSGKSSTDSAKESTFIDVTKNVGQSLVDTKTSQELSPSKRDSSDGMTTKQNGVAEKAQNGDVGIDSKKDSLKTDDSHPQVQNGEEEESKKQCDDVKTKITAEDSSKAKPLEETVVASVQS